MRGTFEDPPTGLIPWFSKTKGNTYATIAASPFPLQGKPTQDQDVARPEEREGEWQSSAWAGGPMGNKEESCEGAEGAIWCRQGRFF